jgi:hypothetical protein
VRKRRFHEKATLRSLVKGAFKNVLLDVINIVLKLSMPYFLCSFFHSDFSFIIIIIIIIIIVRISNIQIEYQD